MMKPLRALALCLLAVASTACSPVFRTSALNEYIQTNSKGGCRGNVGAYALPKGVLDIVVSQSVDPAAAAYYELKPKSDAVFVALTADTKHTYCLDFLSNPFYADSIIANRDANNLLERISSNAEDKSKKIVEDVAKGVAVATATSISGRQFQSGASNSEIQLVQLRFDPFDHALLTQANEALRFTGHCVFIDPADDPYVPLWMASQCGPDATAKPYAQKPEPDEFLRSTYYTAGEGRIGILYKPVLAHTLVIMKQDDPGSAKPWRVWKRLVVEMPNRAPVFILQVHRGLFTTRKAEISFNQGMLTGVTIDKKSELLAVSEAIVNVVGIAVQIPAKVFVIGTNRATNQARLIETNQRLLQTMAAFEDAQRAALLDPAAPVVDAGTFRSGQGAARSVLDEIEFESCFQNNRLEGVEDAEALCRGETAQ